MKSDQLTACMHAVLDGSASADEAQALDTALAGDAGARQEFASWQAMFGALRSLPPAHPPEGLVAAVSAQLPAAAGGRLPTRKTFEPADQLFIVPPVLASRQPRTTRFPNGLRTILHRPGWSVSTQEHRSMNANRKLWVGGAVAAAAVAVGIFATGYPPKAEDVTGTVVPAERYRAPQSGSEAIKLGEQTGAPAAGTPVTQTPVQAAQSAQLQAAQSAAQLDAARSAAQMEAAKSAQMSAAQMDAAKSAQMSAAQLLAAQLSAAQMDAAKSAKMQSAQSAANLQADRAAALLNANRQVSMQAEMMADKTARMQAELSAQMEAEKAARMQAEQSAAIQADKTARMQAALSAQMQAEKAAQMQAQQSAAMQADKTAKMQAAMNAQLLLAQQSAAMQADKNAAMQADKSARMQADKAAASMDASQKARN